MSWILPERHEVDVLRVAALRMFTAKLPEDAYTRREAKQLPQPKKVADPVQQKYARSERRKAWLMANAARIKATHDVWRAKNRLRRNAYYRRWNKDNPRRRAYLTAKQREYRAAKKAAALLPARQCS